MPGEQNHDENPDENPDLDVSVILAVIGLLADLFVRISRPRDEVEPASR